MLADVSPEYERAAARVFGPEQGAAWVGTLRGKPMARIAITPGWVGILDFETRFPSALTALVPAAAASAVSTIPCNRYGHRGPYGGEAGTRSRLSRSLYNRAPASTSAVTAVME